MTQRRILLAAPRGYCAGVERAILIVEQALDRYGPPVYVRKQIVHNAHVVADLTARGAVFVEELEEVPEGAIVVYSAHGVAPAVRDEAQQRGLTAVDATCPLVAKVHAEARRYARDGRHILLIGHAGHEEIDGTLGEAPAHTTLIDSDTDLDRLVPPAAGGLTWLSQTTLAVDEVAETVRELKDRFPALVDPPSDDICYASQNRQDAVKAMAPRCDLVLVVGSANSSNSLRLVDVALAHGAEAAHLIDDAGQADPVWLDKAATVGVTAGASAPEHLVDGVLEWLRGKGFGEVEEVAVTVEDITFAAPPLPERPPGRTGGPRPTTTDLPMPVPRPAPAGSAAHAAALHVGPPHAAWNPTPPRHAAAAGTAPTPGAPRQPARPAHPQSGPAGPDAGEAG
ncbi:MAG TPA: 4-hydroxy-3-methylbut-2-enyl diphosphate reductase [Actinocrinis sp.]|nr:4-hydroxy-3-methylbut-2-enyl diphosphate reductase [Actinocrinis sp.]